MSNVELITAARTLARNLARAATRLSAPVPMSGTTTTDILLAGCDELDAWHADIDPATGIAYLDDPQFDDYADLTMSAGLALLWGATRPAGSVSVAATWRRGFAVTRGSRTQWITCRQAHPYSNSDIVVARAQVNGHVTWRGYVPYPSFAGDHGAQAVFDMLRDGGIARDDAERSTLDISAARRCAPRAAASPAH